MVWMNHWSQADLKKKPDTFHNERLEDSVCDVLTETNLTERAPSQV